MAIASIQIPNWQQGRDLDFTQLSQLPQVWRKAQSDAWTLANIDGLQLTPAIREYNLARRQGFNGTFLDFARARRFVSTSSE
jgi:hypothetical protein